MFAYQAGNFLLVSMNGVKPHRLLVEMAIFFSIFDIVVPWPGATRCFGYAVYMVNYW